MTDYNEKKNPIGERRETNAEREQRADDLHQDNVYLADKLRWMAWVRWVLGIIIGVSLAVVIVTYLQRDNQIEACLRGGERALIDVRFYEAAAEKNRTVARESDTKIERKANNQAAGEYTQFALDKRRTIPMPEGWKGEKQFRGNSLEDRIDGCQEAFPPLIPWVE